MVQLEPHFWRGSNCTVIYFLLHNRSSILTLCLSPIPPLEVLLVQHTDPSLVLALTSLQYYFIELPDGLYFRNFATNITAGWSSQVSNLIITATLIWIIRHDGDLFLFNQRDQYMAERKWLIGLQCSDSPMVCLSAFLCHFYTRVYMGAE